MLTVILLITGTTVGAGMLGLLIKTGLSGLVPSLLGMIVVWGLMLITAWILAGRIIASDHTTTDLPTLFQQELGTPGKWLSIIGYLIIFYGLLVAYLSGASSILDAISKKSFCPISVLGPGFKSRMPTRSYGCQAQKKTRDLAKIGRVYDVVFVRAFNILRAFSGIGMAPNSSEYRVLALWFNS
jgi:hypothetical protein